MLRESPEMSEPIIRLHNVRKSFGAKALLRGVNLSIEPGQTFALLGLNGAGKTTLIRMLLGLLKRDGGSIAILGRDPEREALQVRTEVGFLAEDQQMFGWMTVTELLSFMAPFYKTWDRDLADRYVRRFDLPGQTRIRHLSKGQNVRLGLVLALAHRPQVVVLDDPALGLDPIMRKEFNRDLVTHLQGEGSTVLYSSHLLDEVEPIADAVAILHDGVIIKQAETESLRQEVKQLVLLAEDYDDHREHLKPLDVRRQRSEVAVTVENATDSIRRLAAEGVAVRVVELNLDDIFAAFVTGQADQPPQASPLAPVAVPA
jgi:ABC-2 type transport system ATP-binding protein